MNQPNAAALQFLPETKTIEQLNSVLGTVPSEHLLWISGYCYGLAQNRPLTEELVVDSENQQRIWIVYGSQTGNAKSIAEKLVRDMTENRTTVALKSMADLQPKQLKDCDLLFAIVSTQGEGEPPEDALAFFEILNSNRAPDLKHLSFAILGLGDSSYEYFCETAKQLDERLEALNATRLLPRIDADIDYQQQSISFTEKLLQQVVKVQHNVQHSVLHKPDLKLVAKAPIYSRSHPFTAELFTNQRITGSASLKATHHLEIDISDSGIAYLPGDALGVLVHNGEQQISQLVEVGKFDATAMVQVDGEAISVAKALTERLEITRLHPKVIQNYASNNIQLSQQLESGGRAAILNIVRNYQLIDLLEEFPVNLVEQQLIDLLHDKAERLYSISSSLEVNPDEVHLTVGAVEYQKNNQLRMGTAAHYLTEFQAGEKLAVYLKVNKHFRLPENSDTPIIMVGPGTGVAPFRAFVQHRQSLGQSGKNWLFFGHQYFHSDFLYQLEWQKHLKTGALNRMDVAFSRDQAEKKYVQHRISENARDVYDWMEQGAAIYICGDATHMAKDVEDSLLKVIQSQSTKDNDFAKDYLSQMKAQKRFLKDVY